MRRRAGGKQEVEVAGGRGPEARPAGLGRLVENVDGLTGTVVARPRHPRRGRLPQLPDRPLLADHHSRRAVDGLGGEGGTAAAGWNDVRAEVAERRETFPASERSEAAEPAPRDVLEEDPFDRLPGADF